MTGELAGVIITVTFFVTTAAVVLLRPISRRIGEYLEALVAEKRAAARAADDRVQRALEEMNRRLALLEERVEFAEHLIVPAAPGDAERRIGPAPTGDGERR
ncbi:MAG TPA: hypothetical protein VF212_06475 [Longimicrobiales bacterium]